MIARRAAARALKVGAAAADLVLRPARGVVVLAYHDVGGPRPGAVNLSATAFAEQLDHLATGAAGDVVSLDDAVRSLDPTGGANAEDARPPRVAITFDDGTAGFAAHAVPLLVERGLPVTLYLATDFVERGRSFWDDGTSLSWAALADAVTTGLVSVGSHTHTHVLLDRTEPAVVADELDRSVELIGERLGVEARHFAYPKALAPSPAADRLVRARFASAAVAGGRVNAYGDTDVGRLARTPIQAGDTGGWFRRKAAGGLQLEGIVRERADRRRHAGKQR